MSSSSDTTKMGCKQSKTEKKEAAAAEEAAKKAGEEGGADTTTAPAPGGGEQGGEPKVVVVVGATGGQGGAVAAALVADPGNKYKVRAVTRNPDSDRAKVLKEKGMEVVKANLDDQESLKAVMEGAYAVFAVTNFFESNDPEKETQQGKNLVDSAKAAGVQHFVYSGLENVKEAIGKACHHFDSKSQVETYLKEQDLPHTVVRMAYYMENLIGGGKPFKDDDGNFVLNMPVGDTQMAMISVADCGPCVRSILDAGDEYKDKVVGLGAENLKIEEYAAILNKAFDGKKFIASNKTAEDMAAMDFPGAGELAAMFEFYQAAPPDRDVELTRKLNPDLNSFEQWIEANKAKIEALE